MKPTEGDDDNCVKKRQSTHPENGDQMMLGIFQYTREKAAFH